MAGARSRRFSSGRPRFRICPFSSHEDRPVVITESDRIRRPLYHEPAAERRLGAGLAATISTNAPAIGPGTAAAGTASSRASAPELASRSFLAHPVIVGVTRPNGVYPKCSEHRGPRTLAAARPVRRARLPMKGLTEEAVR